jgi:hypothetical protein
VEKDQERIVERAVLLFRDPEFLSETSINVADYIVTLKKEVMF